MYVSNAKNRCLNMSIVRAIQIKQQFYMKA